MRKHLVKYSPELIKRFKIMNLLCHKNIKAKQAAKELGLSFRQIKRLKRRFKSNGCTIESLAFKRTHPSPIRIPNSIRQKIAELKKQGKWRSCQHIVDFLPPQLSSEEIKWMESHNHPLLSISHQTVKNILKELNISRKTYKKEKPANRFEMSNFGELTQIDAHTVRNLYGFRSLKLILIIDDFSRAILAGRFFLTETTYNTLLLIREAIEKYGLFQMAYSDNHSIYNFILHTDYSRKVIRGNIKFYDYKINPDKVLTRVEEALLDLGIPFLHHAPDNPKATGKIEKLWQFIDNRFINEWRFKGLSLKQLNSQFQKWIHWYNNSWINRDTASTPKQRFNPSVFKPLSEHINLDDIFCLKEQRKVAKDNSFPFDKSIYTISKQHNMVAFTVNLHIHPNKKIRLFHNNKFIQEFKYKPKKGDILTFKQGNLTNFQHLKHLKTEIYRRQP